MLKRIKTKNLDKNGEKELKKHGEDRKIRDWTRRCDTVLPDAMWNAKLVVWNISSYLIDNNTDIQRISTKIKCFTDFITLQICDCLSSSKILKIKAIYHILRSYNYKYHVTI